MCLTKEFDGVFMPPFRRQEQNFGIQIEHEDMILNTSVVSVTWLPEESIISVRSSYIYYDSVDEMNADADSLRSMGWK